MRVVVVTPPEPIVKPSDLTGGYADDDARIQAMIQAVTEEIDGPTGWLGRALGPQTLDCFGWFGTRYVRLPYPPIISIEGVYSVDKDGGETTVDPATYRLSSEYLVVAEGATWVRCESHRIRYRAGYNGVDGAAAGEVQTGPVPERARQAIILSAQHLIAAGAENLFLKAEDVDGVGRREYVVSDAAGKLIRDTADRLLAGLRVYS